MKAKTKRTMKAKTKRQLVQEIAQLQAQIKERQVGSEHDYEKMVELEKVVEVARKVSDGYTFASVSHATFEELRTAIAFLCVWEAATAIIANSEESEAQ